MAKGARSNSKRQLATWRRENLVAKWQQKADEARYAALEQAIQSEPLPAPQPPAEDEVDVKEEDNQGRGRGGAPGASKLHKKAAKKAAKRAGGEDSEGMEVDEEGGSGSGKKGRKGGVAVRGVQKKRRNGKLFLATKNTFHAKKGKKAVRK